MPPQTPQYRPAKNGSWQPYIPTMGMTTGCRPGIRNRAEEFNIAHLAKNYQDDRLVKAAEAKELPAAASCSFQGSTPIPTRESHDEEFLASRSRNSAMKNADSFQSGMILRDTGDTVRPRLHQGKRTEETGASQCLRFGNDPANECSQINQICNKSRSIAPPDNLSTGLLPAEEFSMKPRVMKTSMCGSRMQNLGPGLVPPQLSSERKDDECARVKVVSQGPNGEYIRVYGNGFQDFLDRIQPMSDQSNRTQFACI